MESESILDPDNALQVWCLHFVYIPRMNAALDKFMNGWNNHRISGEGGKTPLQLYVQGAIQHRGSGQTGVDSLFFEPPTDGVAEESMGLTGTVLCHLNNKTLPSWMQVQTSAAP